MTTATKTFYLTKYEMTGTSGENVTRFYLGCNGEWTPNKSQGRGFESAKAAQDAYPSGYAAALVEAVG